MTPTLIRYGAYPIVFGLSATAVLAILAHGVPLWPSLAAVAAAGLAAVALLERVQPYQRAWLTHHGDLGADIVHALVSLGLLSGSAVALHALRIDLPSVWPDAWPIWAQVLLAGAVMDLGIYVMHRMSHRSAWLWRLHATHHSSERLYWLNGERRRDPSLASQARVRRRPGQFR